jgi:hypothetical protein
MIKQFLALWRKILESMPRYWLQLPRALGIDIIYEEKKNAQLTHEIIFEDTAC